VKSPWSTPVVVPGDPDDARLLEQLRPAGHVNPEPQDRYDLVVLGGGTAGLVCAFGAAGLGARVAIVERDLLGGDCLNTGCVPSKAVIAAAAKVKARYGDERPPQEEFTAALAGMREVRADIAAHDSVRRLQGAGIDVFLGRGIFTDGERLEVAGAMLRFRAAVVATGARAAIPPVPGLADVATTNETIFALTERPERLLVLGAGPIGCELSQSFARLGSQVTLVDMADRVLPIEHADASALVLEALREDGVKVVLGTPAEGVATRDGTIVLTAGGEHAGDALLVATGRSPNVDGLGLEAAGVRVDRTGVVVDDRMRTTNPRIYAAGDVASEKKFTHAADAQARIVIRNALFPGSSSAAGLVIPWATYTDPAVAHVGPLPHELESSPSLTALTVPFSDVDRARAELDTRGFARAWVDPKGRMVGATVVGRGAGDLIGEATLAITKGLEIGDLSATIHPYPTRAEVWRKLGDQANRARLTPTAQGWLRRWFRFPWR